MNVVTVVLLAVATVAAGYALKRRQDDVVDDLRAQSNAYDSAIAKIAAAQEEERRQHEENLRQLQKTLDDVARKHDDDLRVLNERKAQQVGQLVRQYDEDPTAMTNKVSEMIGIRVYKEGTK